MSTCMASCGIKSTLSIFKTDTLLYRSRDNVDVKILFGKNRLYFRPKHNMLVRGLYVNKNSMFDSAWSMIQFLAKCMNTGQLSVSFHFNFLHLIFFIDDIPSV